MAKTSEASIQGKFNFVYIALRFLSAFCLVHRYVMYRLYKSILHIARFQQMSRPRANWDATSPRMLLDLYVAEKEKCNFSNQGLTRDGWRNVYRSLKNANLSFMDKQVHNKLSALKDKFKDWKDLQSSHGLRRNPTLGTVVADEEWWPTQDDTQAATQDKVLAVMIPMPFQFIPTETTFAPCRGHIPGESQGAD